MFDTFPQKIEHITNWTWQHFKPYANYLRSYTLNADTVTQWLEYETRFFALITEWGTRLRLRRDSDTTNQAAQQALARFNYDIQPQLDQLQQDLTQKLLASDLHPPNYEIPLRHLHTDAGLHIQTDSEVHQETEQLRVTYQQIIASQTVIWDGKEQSIDQLTLVMNTPDRSTRQSIYEAIQQRRTEDKLHFDSIWLELMSLRKQIMHEANISTFRDLRWRQLKRFDYTPRDVSALCSAIEKVIVPLMQQRHEQQRQRLNVATLCPYDLFYDPAAKDLTPYQSLQQLLRKAEKLFTQIDPQFGTYFQIMRREKLLDLESKPNKAPATYTTTLPHSKRPFIFLNAVGGHADVLTLIHQAGHAFHTFESAKWPYLYQRQTPNAMNELAAMTLELLALDHYGIFYPDAESQVYARRLQLEGVLQCWLDAAISTTFQHWVYAHHDAARDAASCDAKWRELLLRYYPGIDFRGYEQQMLLNWWHEYDLFFHPFTAIESAIAQLGAIEIWQAAQKNPERAIKCFRSALARGNTQSLSNFYQAAGATFAFDEATLRQAAEIIEAEFTVLQT